MFDGVPSRSGSRLRPCWPHPFLRARPPVIHVVDRNQSDCSNSGPGTTPRPCARSAPARRARSPVTPCWSGRGPTPSRSRSGRARLAGRSCSGSQRRLGQGPGPHERVPDRFPQLDQDPWVPGGGHRQSRDQRDRVLQDRDLDNEVSGAGERGRRHRPGHLARDHDRARSCRATSPTTTPTPASSSARARPGTSSRNTTCSRNARGYIRPRPASTCGRVEPRDPQRHLRQRGLGHQRLGRRPTAATSATTSATATATTASTTSRRTTPGSSRTPCTAGSTPASRSAPPG